MKKCCRNCTHVNFFVWRGLDGKPKVVFTCNYNWCLLETEIKNAEAYTSCKTYLEDRFSKRPRPTKKEILDYYE